MDFFLNFPVCIFQDVCGPVGYNIVGPAEQQFLPAIYEQVPGISYIDVSIYTTTSASEGQPSSYPLRSVEITNRQRAMTSSTRIEVALDD